MDRPLPPNRYTAAPPDQLRHGQAPSSAGEIPTAPPYYPNITQMGAAGGWVQHQADGQLLGWEQQADGRSQLRRGDYNSSSSIPAGGGWEQQDSVVLPWLENAAQGGQRRRVLAPNSSAAASSNPFLDVCSAQMDSGRPLTDMIMEDFTPGGVSNNISPHNEIEARDEVPAAVKGNKRRSKNFTVKEDEMLVSAWLNVSLDPVRGVNQSKDTYWKRIHDYFHSKKDFESDRTQSSLMSRWSSILHDCNIFASCVSKVEARNQSGASVDDKQANALTMYKNDDPFHRTFQYIHCWKILKDHSKWTNRRMPTGLQKPFSKKQKTTADSTPTTDAPDPVTGTVAETETTITTVERPIGTRKEKLKLKQRSSIEALDYLLAKKKEVDAEKELKKKERELKKEERELKKQEMCQKALALQEERIKLDKEKFDFDQDREEERIINIDMSTMSTRQQQFYDDQQKKILARRLGN